MGLVAVVRVNHAPIAGIQFFCDIRRSRSPHPLEQKFKLPVEKVPSPMHLLADLRDRFSKSLTSLGVNAAEYVGMIRPAQDSKFGDYQANFAMTLAKPLGKAPRDVANELKNLTPLTDLCSQVEIAGPGFINLRIDDELLKRKLRDALQSDCLAVEPTQTKKTIVIDFSSPNVAKPMHVGHIRSTVIGDALSRVARFLGHRVITDNHLGDWGTQFGMIIYGYKNFCDATAYKKSPIQHLGSLYRLVRQLCDYHDSVKALPMQEQQQTDFSAQLAKLKSAPEPADKAEKKQQQKDQQRLTKKLEELQEEIDSTRGKISKVENDTQLKQLAAAHAAINQRVLEETAKLHESDAENLRFWNEFLPYCSDDIERIYKRLGVTFDHVLGESFYHDQLGAVVEDFTKKKLATNSDGAMCVFMDGFDAPMLIQKSDGAYLYATTDLATIKYRAEEWRPDIVLYVVDHRQHEHFDKLFAAAAKWGYTNIDLRHVSFGTVLGEDGRPFKTRAGDTVGLEGLLDEAERKAQGVLLSIQKETADPLAPDEIDHISKVVGIGALKFADLSQNRSSDYTFSYDKMLELKGYTATYLQYLYARVQGIYRKDNVNIVQYRDQPRPFVFAHELERQLALQLLRFAETLDEVLVDYRPNILAQYLFDLTQTFFRFYDQCPVLSAETEALRDSRLQLCDLTARTVKQGLELLGIGVVEKM
ncbi:MAG: arginine--tRNA ligase [Pirellulaceae bacterium]